MWIKQSFLVEWRFQLLSINKDLILYMAAFWELSIETGIIPNLTKSFSMLFETFLYFVAFCPNWAVSISESVKQKNVSYPKSI